MHNENPPENIDDMPVQDTEQHNNEPNTDELSLQLKDAEERVLRAQAEIENATRDK